MSLFKQAFLCLALVALAAGGYYVYEHPQSVGIARESAGPSADGAKSAARRGNRIPGLIAGDAVNVITAEVATDEGGETVVALGTAKAARSVTLYPEVTGIVSEVMFTPGQPVEAGAELIRLESDVQQVAVDRARLALKQAQATVERAHKLAESKTISDVAMSDAETAAQLAEIEVRTAEIELRRRTSRAPFAGVTGLSDISVGDLVTTSTPITTLDDLSTVIVGFELPERWAGRVALDQRASAMAQGLPGSEFSGRISAIDSRVDEATRTLRVEAELANEGRALKTGMAITMRLEFPTDEQLAVPTLAVQWDRRGSFVWKIVDGAARRAQVAIISRESGQVMVQGELEHGDKVVVEGIQRLREGAKVAEVGVEPAIVDEGGEAAPATHQEPAVSGTGNPARVRRS
jgi:RND family efflux transporter MFP subunit